MTLEDPHCGSRRSGPDPGRQPDADLVRPPAHERIGPRRDPDVEVLILPAAVRRREQGAEPACMLPRLCPQCATPGHAAADSVCARCAAAVAG